MAVLSSIDGKFYEIPDDVAQRYEVAADKVKEVLAKVDPEMAEGGPEGTRAYGAGGPAVVIHVSGDGAYVEDPNEPAGDGGVEPYWGYGYRRRYYKPHYHYGHHHHHGWWGRRYYKRYYW